MPATIYSEIDALPLTSLRQNKDKKTYSAYFENHGKIQLGHMDGTKQEAMSISDLMKGKGVTGIRKCCQMAVLHIKFYSTTRYTK